MFVQVTKSRRGTRTYETFLVRESFRTPEGPRSRTVCNITGLPEHVRSLIKAALRGDEIFTPGSVKLEGALDYGGLAVLVDAWNRFEMDRLFDHVADRRQRGLIKAVIFSRLLFPCAKLALAQRARGSLLAQACGLAADESFAEDEIYEAMDQLNGSWVAIEKQLYRQAFAEGCRLVLYDLSSVYFEGKGPARLARYGHSRDHRSDRTQIVLAVATDTQGIPLHVEVLRGNRGDTTTLLPLLHTLGRRFGIDHATFVFDGGMSSRINLESLDAQKLGYITRLSASMLQSLVDELPQDQQLQLGERGELIEITHQGRRYVIAGGPWRQQRDVERRNARIQKGEAELKRLAAVRRKRPNAQKLSSQAGRALQRLKAHKYFDYHVDESGQLQWERKTDLIASEEIIDGWYLLHTNQSLQQCSSDQVLAHYKGLLDVEEAFCEIKNYLEVRPVFHYKPDRVRNHVRLCFLSYWLSARLGQEWRALGEKGEVPRILRELQAIRVGFLHFGQHTFKPLLSQVPEALNPLIAKLKLTKLFSSPPAWARL